MTTAREYVRELRSLSLPEQIILDRWMESVETSVGQQAGGLSNPVLAAGSPGVAGEVDIYPPLATLGKAVITCQNQAFGATVSVVVGTMAGARTLLVPDPGKDASFVMSQGNQAIGGVKSFASEQGTALGVGIAPNVCCVAVETIPVIHKTVIQSTAVPVPLTVQSGQGWYGGVELYDWPVGLIQVIGVSLVGTLTLKGFPLPPTPVGFVGVGQAIPTSYVDAGNVAGSIVPKTVIGPVPVPILPIKAVSANAVYLDGRAVGAKLFMNFLITDYTSGMEMGVFTGVTQISWINLSA